MGDRAVPDAWLPAVQKASGIHRFNQQRFVRESSRVKDEVGVSGERLIPGQPVDGADIDRLRADQDERVEVRAKPDESVEQDPPGIDVLAPDLATHGSSGSESSEATAIEARVAASNRGAPRLRRACARTR